MKMAGILTLAGVACAIGALMPGEQVPAETAAAPSHAEAQAKASAAFGEARQDYLSGDIVLSRQMDGHFYASPAINAVRIETLVDTGATVIALTAADADAAGVRWDESEVRPVGRGANGTIMGVPVTLDRVELGTFEVHDVPAIVIPEGLDVTLLGQAFLSRIPNVAISDDEMRLSDS